MREIVIPSFYCLSRPISEVLEGMADAGVRLIELHGDAPDIHVDLTNKSAVSAIAWTVERLPLGVHSIHCAFSSPSEHAWDISQPDVGGRAAALSRRMKVIASAAMLDARYVIVHPGVRQRGRERLARCREGLAQLVETAREHGTKIAVENLPPDHLGGSLEEIRWILDGLDPEVAGFCLDTGHAMLGQDDPCDYIRGLGDRLCAIHWHTNNHEDDAHLFPGVDGTVWDDFFAALDEVGYDLPVTVEAVPPETVSLADAVREVRAALQEGRTPRVL
jgi:sugar phosphate isomerase/epimerase